ncbi:MAG: hypothetical protein Q8936_03160 [Bacillota bacterium]|nr:hypothetical protein [Bacillota bacterium]
MRVLNQFDIYFVIIMVVQGIIVGFFDSKSMTSENRQDTALKAKVVGIGAIVIAIIAYIARWIFG